MYVRGCGGRREALPGRSPCHHAAGFCTRFGSPYPVLPFLGLVYQHMSQSRFFFQSHSIGPLLSRRSGHSTPARPPTLRSPFFFSSHGNSKFEGKGWIPPNQVFSPPLLRPPGCPARSLLLLLSPLHFSVTLSLLLSPGHLYLDLRINVQQCVARHRGTPMTPHRSRPILSFCTYTYIFCYVELKRGVSSCHRTDTFLQIQ